MESPLQELDRKFHLHPFTDHRAMHASSTHGTHIIRSGTGCTVTDETGRTLLDGLAGLWCVNVGYGRKEIADAVATQMATLPFYCSFFNSTTEPAVLLAEKLASLAPPGLSRTVFCNSGSEANETALKIIRAVHKLRGESGRSKILTRQFAYHGVTLAATSMTGLPSCTAPFDLPLPGFIHVPAPYPYAVASTLSQEEYGVWCIAETRRIIEHEGPETIAAFFAEPVQGAGGVIPPPPGYLTALRQLCREFGILFVADEVISGFGRLGAWFASTLWDLQPDLMTLAKGITSGYLPLGACMLSDAVAETLMEGGAFAHGFTYSGHPTCAAAGLANIAILENDNLIPRVRDDVGPYFQRKLREFAGHPAVGEVRGFQLIGALELVPKGGRANLRPDMMLGVKAAAIAREEGVIVRGIRDIVALAPPLVVTHEEIDQLFAAVGTALDRV